MNETIEDPIVEDVPIEAEEVRFTQAAKKVASHSSWMNTGSWSLLLAWAFVSAVLGFGFVTFISVTLALVFVTSILEVKMMEKRIAKVYQAFYQKAEEYSQRVDSE